MGRAISDGIGRGEQRCVNGNQIKDTKGARRMAGQEDGVAARAMTAEDVPGNVTAEVFKEKIFLGSEFRKPMGEYISAPASVCQRC